MMADDINADHSKLEPHTHRLLGCPAGCLTLPAIICLLLGVIILVGPRVVSKFYFRRNMTPAVSARYDELTNKRLSLPPSWLTPVAIPPYVRNAIDDLQTTALASMRGTSLALLLDGPDLRDAFVALQHGDAIGTEGWTTISQVVAQAHSLIDGTSETINLPNYDLSIGANGHIAGGGVPHWRLGTLACFAAHLSARDGRYAEALDYAMLPIREARGHPTRDTMSAQSGWHLVRLASDCIADIVTSSTDRDALRRTFKGLDTLRMDVAVITGLPISVLEAVGRMRNFAADGYPITIMQGRSATRYFSQYLSASAGYAQWKIPTLPVGSRERDSLERALRSLDTKRDFHVSLNTLLAFVDIVAPDFLTAKLIDMDDQAPTEEEIVAAERYDLAALRIATRLAELDGLTSITSQKQLVPKYLPRELMDPATGTPYLWHAATRQFYGVGPDRVDAMLAAQYDPHTQMGDVTVPGPLPIAPAYTPSHGAFYQYGRHSFFPPGL